MLPAPPGLPAAVPSPVLAARVAVGLVGAVVVAVTLLSAARTVVLPRAVPARLARLGFLAARATLRALASRARPARRRELLAVVGPASLFSQLLVWAALLLAGFAAALWAVTGGATSAGGARDAVLLAFSSLTTLGVDHPPGRAAAAIGDVGAGAGLLLLAFTVTYLPTIYSAFSRREAVVAKLVLRAGAPPTGPALLASTWELGRFDRLEEVWLSWQEWFIDLGETHVSFPQLPFFGSLRPDASWVVAAGAVLDAAALVLSGAVPHEERSRVQLCARAGGDALHRIADFLGVQSADEPARLPRRVFDEALLDLGRRGLDVGEDTDAAWERFAEARRSYERPLLVLAGLTDAEPTAWLPGEQLLGLRPPLRLGRRRQPRPLRP